MIYWVALFASVVANIGANVAFKRVMATADLSLNWKSVWALAFDPVLWLAFVLCFILLGGYLYALKAIPMGIAYTIATSLSIVGIAVAGVVLYGESLGLKSIIGIALIMAGLLLFAGADIKKETVEQEAQPEGKPQVLQPARQEGGDAY